MTDPFTAGVIAKNKRIDAKNAENAAKTDRERAVWMTGQQDWQPEYASDHIGAYQRSTSPVAQGYLESFLAGNNPAAIQGTRNLAPQMKARAQSQFNQQTGGWDALRAKQQEMESSTPWAVTPVDREMTKPDYSNNAYKASIAGGLSPEEYAQLSRDDFKFDKQGRFRTSKSGADAKLAVERKGLNLQTDSPEQRQYMRGLARARAQGVSLDDAVALGKDELIRRGA